ncbi:MAG: hypothetical protein A2X22_01620 [Bacteroidetes bacterium GWF2_49_14]|nr:MAG: hypothetical protein A2X22_01620 [Bacteroidetes bacterium GWF2_49_14]
MNHPRNLEEFKKWLLDNQGKTLFLQYENRKAVNKTLAIVRANSSSVYFEDENRNEIRIPYPRKGHYRFHDDSFRLSSRDFKYSNDTRKPKTRGGRFAADPETIIFPETGTQDINTKIRTYLSMFPEGHSFSEKEKSLLKKYRNTGPIYQNPAFHVQQSIAEQCWKLASRFGFHHGGNVLDPAAGVGCMIEHSIRSLSNITLIEPDPIAARILRILYRKARVLENEFSETILSSKEKKSGLLTGFPGAPFDLIISTPPIGSWTGISDMDEIRRTQANGISEYYLSRAIDLLKPSGLIIYILRNEHLSKGKSFLELGLSPSRKIIDSKADLIEAFRFPKLKIDGVPINSDLVVFRKK